MKQVVAPPKRKSPPPPADIDDEIGLEILAPGVEDPRSEPKLLFDRKHTSRTAQIPGQRPKDVGVHKRRVNQILLARHNNQKSEAIQKKESAWKEKGGSTFKPLADNKASLGEYLERIESADQQQRAEDDENESDEEYRPSQDHRSRSASPPDEDTENNPPPPLVPRPESAVESGDDTEEHDENVAPTWNPRTNRTITKMARIHDSDDEEGDADGSRILVPSTSTLDIREFEKSPIPLGEGRARQSLTPADGETDKENVDDNKENAAVPSSSRSVFSAFASPRVWGAPVSPSPSRQPQAFERPAPDVRSPLSELRTEGKDEDIFGSSSRRKLSTASNSSFGPPPLPAPLFGRPAGSDDEDDDMQPAPLMRKGFSQLFGTVPGRSLTFGESPKKSQKVSLTVQGFLPSSDRSLAEGRIRRFPERGRRIRAFVVSRCQTSTCIRGQLYGSHEGGRYLPERASGYHASRTRHDQTQEASAVHRRKRVCVALQLCLRILKTLHVIGSSPRVDRLAQIPRPITLPHK